MAVLQAVVIALIALIVTPGYLFYFDVTPKIAILLVGTAAALIWPRGTPAGRAPRSFSVLVGASLISLAISSALSPDPAISLFGTNWRRYGAVTQAVLLAFAWLMTCGAAAKPERVRTLLRGVVISGAATAIYGILQYFGWDPMLPKAAYHIGEGIWTIVRPPGTLGYASYFATWLLGVCFLSFALSRLETGARIRRLCYTAAALAAVAMLLTGTRAAMLGLVAGIAVWAASRGFRIPRRVLGVGALLVLAGIAFYYSPPGWQLRSRTRWFVEDPLGGGRVHLWRDSVSMAVRRPLGYGPETFTAEFPRFESEELARAYPDFLHESPHNIFLDAWVSQGIPGLAVLIGFCWVGLAGAWRSGQVWLAAGLAAIIASQMFTVFTMPTAMVFYTTIAMAVGTKKERPVPAPHWEVWPRWALAMLLAYGAVRLTLADRQLALAQGALERGDVAAASLHYGGYDKLRWPGSGSDLWYSRTCSNLAAKAPNPMVRVQALVQAGAAGQRATRTSEEPFNAWYSLSALYAGQNDIGSTEKCLRAAIAARPNWFKPHWTLAQVLRLEGRLEEAEKEAALAAGRNGGKNPEVTHTLDEIRALRRPGHAQP